MPLWGFGRLTEMPVEFLAAAMQIIAIWTNVELLRARVLARLLKSDRRVAMAMFYGVRTDEARADMLEAAAAAAADRDILSKRDYALLAGCMELADRAKKTRHLVAHGVSVRYESRPDLLAIAQPGDLAIHNAEYREFREIARSLMESPRTYGPITANEHRRRERLGRKLVRRRIDIWFDNSRTRRLTADDLAGHLRVFRIVETTWTMLEDVLARTPHRAVESRQWVRVALYNAQPRILRLSRKPRVPRPSSSVSLPRT